MCQCQEKALLQRPGTVLRGCLAVLLACPRLAPEKMGRTHTLTHMLDCGYGKDGEDDATPSQTPTCSRLATSMSVWERRYWPTCRLSWGIWVTSVSSLRQRSSTWSSTRELQQNSQWHGVYYNVRGYAKAGPVGGSERSMATFRESICRSAFKRR